MKYQLDSNSKLLFITKESLSILYFLVAEILYFDSCFLFTLISFLKSEFSNKKLEIKKPYSYWTPFMVLNNQFKTFSLL